MDDQEKLGENPPVVGGDLGALGAPFVNPTIPLNTAPLQENRGASSSTSVSLTMTEFKDFMDAFKRSMESSIKALVGEEVDKKLASLSQTPSTSSTFFPNTTLDVDGVKETPKRHAPNTAPSYNVAAPSYARPHIPMPHINHIGDPPPPV